MNHKVQTVLHTSIKPGRCHESRRQTRRHHFRRTTLAVMALLLFCLCLGGCIRTFDCSGYIQGMLDATYKGECDDYAAATHSEVSDIMQDYNDFIAHETDIFLHFCGLTADDVIPEDLTQQLLKHPALQAVAFLSVHERRLAVFEVCCTLTPGHLCSSCFCCYPLPGIEGRLC